MLQYDDVTGVILAGGASRRMGRDKATLELDGCSLYARIEEVLRRCFPQVLIAGARPDLAGADVPFFPDLYPESALGGLYTGLYRATTPYVFVAPCDLAAPQEELVRLLVACRRGNDAVVIDGDTGPEPLFAVYGKTALPTMRERLERGEYKIQELLTLLRVRYVTPGELPAGWEAGLRNLNRPADLERLAREQRR